MLQKKIVAMCFENYNYTSNYKYYNYKWIISINNITIMKSLNALFLPVVQLEPCESIFLSANSVYV